jgi:hypothetical protein
MSAFSHIENDSDVASALQQLSYGKAPESPDVVKVFFILAATCLLSILSLAICFIPIKIFFRLG